METILAGELTPELTAEFEFLNHKNDVFFDAHPSSRSILLEYGNKAHNGAYIEREIETLLKSKSLTTPMSDKLFRDSFATLLSNDNFKALGSLINLAEDKSIDISGIDFSSFRTSIDKHLNQSYNFSNILVFLKYYTYFFECRFKHYKLSPTSLASRNKLEYYTKARLVFRDTDIVEMSEVFKTLV
jgi:hypothetical protein